MLITNLLHLVKGFFKLDESHQDSSWSLNEDVLSLAKQIINSVPAINSPKRAVAGLMLAKGYKTLSAILILCKNGYYEDAQILSRTIFEAQIILVNILNDQSDQTAEKYLDHDDMESYALYTKIEKSPVLSKLILEHDKSEDMKQMFDKCKQKTVRLMRKHTKAYKSKWHEGRKMSELASEAQLSDYYSLVYPIQSHLVHSTSGCGRYYFDTSSGIPKISLKSESSELGNALDSSCYVYLGIVMECNAFFELGFDDIIISYISRLSLICSSFHIDDEQI